MKIEEVKIGDRVEEREPQMKRNIGEKVKTREGFRMIRFHSDSKLTSSDPHLSLVNVRLRFPNMEFPNMEHSRKEIIQESYDVSPPKEKPTFLST